MNKTTINQHVLSAMIMYIALLRRNSNPGIEDDVIERGNYKSLKDLIVVTIVNTCSSD